MDSVEPWWLFLAYTCCKHTPPTTACVHRPQPVCSYQYADAAARTAPARPSELAALHSPLQLQHPKSSRPGSPPACVVPHEPLLGRGAVSSSGHTRRAQRQQRAGAALVGCPAAAARAASAAVSCEPAAEARGGSAATFMCVQVASAKPADSHAARGPQTPPLTRGVIRAAYAAPQPCRCAPLSQTWALSCSATGSFASAAMRAPPLLLWLRSLQAPLMQ